MKIISIIIILLSYKIILAQEPEFSNRFDLGEIRIPALDEASGIAASRKYKNILWSHNDGSQGKIFAFDTQGNFIAEFKLSNSLIHQDSDFEDIAIGPGPIDGIDYIYLGDIGDNDSKRKVKYVLRFPEPTIDINNSSTNTQIIKNVDLLPFSYPDSARDSETLMIDPLTKDIYHVSKRETFVAVYKMPYPQTIDKLNNLEKSNTLTIGKSFFDGSGVTGGDISPNGKEILLRDYQNVYYYYRNDNESIIDAFNRVPITISQYNLFPFIEPQGEAICWSFLGNGFFTTGEIRQNIKPHLSYFKKNSTNIENEIKNDDLVINYKNNTISLINNQFGVNYSFKLFNFIGQELYNRTLNENIFNISLDFLQNGTYFVSIFSDNSVILLKSVSIVK